MHCLPFSFNFQVLSVIFLFEDPFWITNLPQAIINEYQLPSAVLNTRFSISISDSLNPLIMLNRTIIDQIVQK